ncbi:MAG: zinc ABC transporter substrate-binding protein [Fimbriimonadaceae bacterium]|nr:zinc ABC transporter substrate-binding protein [Fimbriimonadaceae bacterium]
MTRASNAIGATILFAILVLSGCGANTGRGRWSGEYPIEIAATTGIVGELVKAVGRDKVLIKPLIGPGADPHAFVPGPDDERLLESVHGVVANGLGLEAKMGGVLARVGKTKPILAVGERLPQSRLIEVGQAGGNPTYDPHVWFDVALFADALDAVAAWLGEIDPAAAKSYQMNAGEYKAQLKQLHEVVRNRLATIPKERRVVIATHDAFAYLGRAFGLDAPKNDGSVQALADLLVLYKAPVLFSPEPATDARAEQAVRLAKQRGIQVRVVGPLLTDSLGPIRSTTGSYSGMIEHNAGQIADALAGRTD